MCNDVSQDPRFFARVDRKTGFKTKAVLCAPLKHTDQTIGVIEVLNTAAPTGFSQEDLQLLSAFGELATPAIYRMRAFAAGRKCGAGASSVSQRLTFGGISANANAHYYYSVSIPPTFNGRRSGLISYRVDEVD